MWSYVILKMQAANKLFMMWRFEFDAGGCNVLDMCFLWIILIFFINLKGLYAEAKKKKLEQPLKEKFIAW